MLSIPLKRVQDLKGDQRKVMIDMIRILSRDICNVSHLGLEASEEALTELINKGYAKIIWYEEDGEFALSHYDFKTQSYMINGRKV